MKDKETTWFGVMIITLYAVAIIGTIVMSINHAMWRAEYNNMTSSTAVAVESQSITSLE